MCGIQKTSRLIFSRHLPAKSCRENLMWYNRDMGPLGQFLPALTFSRSSCSLHSKPPHSRAMEMILCPPCPQCVLLQFNKKVEVGPKEVRFITRNLNNLHLRNSTSFSGAKRGLTCSERLKTHPRVGESSLSLCGDAL